MEVFRWNFVWITDTYPTALKIPLGPLEFKDLCIHGWNNKTQRDAVIHVAAVIFLKSLPFTNIKMGNSRKRKRRELDYPVLIGQNSRFVLQSFLSQCIVWLFIPIHIDSSHFKCVILWVVWTVMSEMSDKLVIVSDPGIHCLWGHYIWLLMRPQETASSPIVSVTSEKFRKPQAIKEMRKLCFWDFTLSAERWMMQIPKVRQITGEQSILRPLQNEQFNVWWGSGQRGDLTEGCPDSGCIH